MKTLFMAVLVMSTDLTALYLSMWVETYYCEVASQSTEQYWYTSDLLWDGMQCTGLKGPCCNRTGLPWFNKKLSSTSSANIEVHVCLDMDVLDKNIGIQLMELFVK